MTFVRHLFPTLTGVTGASSFLGQIKKDCDGAN